MEALRVVLSGKGVRGERTTIDLPDLTELEADDEARAFVVVENDIAKLEPLQPRIHLYAGEHAGMGHVIPFSQGPPRLGRIGSDRPVAGILHPEKYVTPDGGTKLALGLQALLGREREQGRKRAFVVGVRRALFNRLEVELGRAGGSVEHTEAIVGIVGSSHRMQQLRAEIVEAAQQDAPALIVGPLGSGKARVASALHELSPRSHCGKLHAVNVSELDPSRIESELFGHAQGAISGGDRDQAGHLKRAGGGTLFLDELSALPLHVQTRLLQVVESREFYPLGSEAAEPFKARLVCATDRDVRQLLRGDALRADLLSCMRHVVFTPALYEHRSDIPELAEALWKELRPNGPPLPADALDVLRGHPWRENTRDLRAALVVIAASGKEPTAELTRRLLIEQYRALGGGQPSTAGPHAETWLRNHQLLDEIMHSADRCLLEVGEGISPAALSQVSDLCKECHRAGSKLASLGNLLKSQTNRSQPQVDGIQRTLENVAATAREEQASCLENGGAWA